MNAKRTEYQRRMDSLFARWIEGKFLTDEEQYEMVAHATGKRDSNGNPIDAPQRTESAQEPTP